jgi:hypothetical protein
MRLQPVAAFVAVNLWGALLVLETGRNLRKSCLSKPQWRGGLSREQFREAVSRNRFLQFRLRGIPRRSPAIKRTFSKHSVASQKGGRRSQLVARATSPIVTSWICRSHLPSSFYSKTSSARASSEGGRTTPSARAACVLITISNRAARSTGKSPGFAPLKIRSTNEAARR